MSAARIPAPFLGQLLLRGIILWLLARLSVLAVAALATDAGISGAQEAIAPGWILSFWAVVITAALVLVDLQRRKELMLLHNLGVTTSHPVLIGMIPALTIEIFLSVLR